MRLRTPPWYRQPLWWLTLIVGLPLAAAVALMIWALADRTVPITYKGLHAGAYDPATHILTLQWTVKRRRYCPGELVRTIEADIGGRVILPSVVIDPEADAPDERRRKVGTTYIGRANLIEIPPTVGGTIKLSTLPRFWCSPFQRFVPIEVPAPPIIFTMPDPKTWTGGGMSVQVGPIPE
jgi:hypothetical protein